MFYEASAAGVLRIIFWIVVISFLFRLIARMALPYAMKKAEQNMRERMNNYQQSQQPKRSEGDVSIQSEGAKGKRNPSEGEYVDYVEIKD